MTACGRLALAMSRSIVGAFVGVLPVALLISPGGAVSRRMAAVALPASAHTYDSPSAATLPTPRQPAVALIGKLLARCPERPERLEGLGP